MTLRFGYAAFLVVVLTGLPLLGIVLAGIPIAPYLEFPPRTAYVAHAPFSWTIFVTLAVMMLTSLGFLLSRFLPWTSRRLSADLHRPVDQSRATAFPWWGRIAVLWTAVWWLLAWTRLPWMTSLQEHTFTPLWLGYIVVINASTYRYTGHCMMLHRPRYFLSLFPLSAVFWWFFEYLNRFVENWYYVGVADLSPLEYVLRATVSFSTVLPAVLGTSEWLSLFAPFTVGLARCRPIDWKPGRRARWITLCAAAVGITGLGLWPDYLFPLVWVDRCF